MQKNKIDFIVDLLADKRISVPLKEKTFELASREVKGVLNIESENLERILEIENRLKLFVNNKPENSKIKFYHNPKETIKFLKLFDSDLKYLTHRWDSEAKFDKDGLLEKARKELNKYAEWTKKDNGRGKITGYKIPESLGFNCTLRLFQYQQILNVKYLYAKT